MDYFIKRPIFAIVIAIVIVILGSVSMSTLPVEQFPNITPPMVQVSANYLGADATAVNSSVATPLGESIIGVDDMLCMSSTSANNGEMNLTISFDIGSDPDMNTIFTQNRVSEALADMPESVKELGVTTEKTMDNFLVVASIYSEDNQYDGSFLSNYAYINIRNELLKINGVGKVTLFGAGEYAMRIWVDPEMLNYMGLTMEEITQAITSQTGDFPVGQLGAEPSPDDTEFTYTLIMPTPIDSAEQYENIIVKVLPDGTTVKLGQISTITLGANSYGVSSTINGNACATLAVFQAPGSNALAVGNEVKETFDRLSKTFVDGVKYEIIIDSTTVISEGVEEIIMTLLLVLLLVMIIIFIFIQNLRSSLIPLIAIPVSLIGTFMLFPLFGITINIFSLLGLVLAVGLVVDDAIVVVEAVQLNIDSGMKPYEATVAAMKKVSPAIIATTIVLVAVFVPISLMSGVTGLLFSQFAISIALSFVISGINALTLSPALCAMMLKKGKTHEKGFFKWFNNYFDSARETYMKRATSLTKSSKRIVAYVVLSLVIVVAGFKMIPEGFFPEENQGYFFVTVKLPDGASLERTEKVCAEINGILKEKYYVTDVCCVSGYNLLSSIMATNSAIVFVKMDDWQKRSLDITKISKELNEELYFVLNDAEAYVFGPPTIPGLGNSSGYSMALIDKAGNTPQYLYEHAEKFIAEAKKRPEIESVMMQFSTNIPQKAIKIDELAVMKFGVNLNQLHKYLATMLGGDYINNFNRFGQLYRTYVQADTEFRQNEDNFRSYFIENNKGESIPISSMVTVKDTVGVNYISQYNLNNSIAITGSQVNKYSSGEALAALGEVADNVLPADMGYEWTDLSYQEVNASKGTTLIYVLILVLIFLILAALYENWKLPLSILMGIPLTLAGAFVTIYLAHLLAPEYIDNVFFKISLIVLIAISTKNFILVVEYAHKAHTVEGKDVEVAALEAAKLRYRPIIMTALAFILGTIPLILATGANAHSRNMIGLALLGGMLAAMLVSVIFYPALYAMVMRKRKKGSAPTVTTSIIALLFLGSCSVGPNFKAPIVDTPEEYVNSANATINTKDSVTYIEWWKQFNDPILDNLIMTAVENNKDLKIAMKRVMASNLEYKNSRASFAPSFGIEGVAEGVYNNTTKTVQNYSANLTMAWEVDIFGGLRRASEASKASMLSTTYGYNATMLSLTSSVANTYFTMLENKVSLDISKLTLKLREETLNLMDSMYKYGATNLLSLNQALALKIEAELSISQYANAFNVSQRSMNILLGELPENFDIPGEVLFNLKAPKELPSLMPAWILHNRPDVIQAYYEMVKSNAMIGVAVAKRYPSLTLTPSGGVLHSITSLATTSHPFIWSAPANIAMSLLNFGTNKRNVNIARINNEATLYTFEKTVLTAFSEIENAISDMNTYTNDVAYYKLLVSVSRENVKLTNALFNGGYTDYFNVINVEKTLFEAKLNYTKAISSQMNSYVSLYKAIGGGWQ